MLKIIFSVFLILLLIPFSQVFSAEFTDNLPTLSVSISNDTPFVYQDSDGYTVVVGMVENNNSLTSIDNVPISDKGQFVLIHVK
jgi:negative regulator of sigma E activity